MVAIHPVDRPDLVLGRWPVARCSEQRDAVRYKTVSKKQGQLSERSESDGTSHPRASLTAVNAEINYHGFLLRRTIASCGHDGPPRFSKSGQSRFNVTPDSGGVCTPVSFF